MTKQEALNRLESLKLNRDAIAPSLSSMTVSELRRYADKYAIPLGKCHNKAEMVNRIVSSRWQFEIDHLTILSL